jgi:hypothetical protein
VSTSRSQGTRAETFHLHPHPALDAHQPLEPDCPFRRILVLDQHRRLEVRAVGDERVVGVELLLDALFLERLLDRSISWIW